MKAKYAFVVFVALFVVAGLWSVSFAASGESFFSSAVISGRCRDVKDVLANSSDTIQMYRLNEKEKGKTDQFGSLYKDNHGDTFVCLDDLAVTPFVEKNVEGEQVSVSGSFTAGRNYGLEDREILLINSMKLPDSSDK